MKINTKACLLRGKLVTCVCTFSNETTSPNIHTHNNTIIRRASDFEMRHPTTQFPLSLMTRQSDPIAGRCVPKWCCQNNGTEMSLSANAITCHPLHAPACKPTSVCSTEASFFSFPQRRFIAYDEYTKPIISEHQKRTSIGLRANSFLFFSFFWFLVNVPLGEIQFAFLTLKSL